MKEWYAAVSGRSDMSEYLVLCPPVGPEPGPPTPSWQTSIANPLGGLQNPRKRFCKRQLKGVSNLYKSTLSKETHGLGPLDFELIDFMLIIT